MFLIVSTYLYGAVGMKNLWFLWERRLNKNRLEVILSRRKIQQIKWFKNYILSIKQSDTMTNKKDKNTNEVEVVEGGKSEKSLV